MSSGFLDQEAVGSASPQDTGPGQRSGEAWAVGTEGDKRALVHPHFAPLRGPPRGQRYTCVAPGDVARGPAHAFAQVRSVAVRWLVAEELEQSSHGGPIALPALAPSDAGSKRGPIAIHALRSRFLGDDGGEHPVGEILGRLFENTTSNLFSKAIAPSCQIAGGSFRFSQEFVLRSELLDAASARRTGLEVLSCFIRPAIGELVVQQQVEQRLNAAAAESGWSVKSESGHDRSSREVGASSRPGAETSHSASSSP